ncbi:hypothetical protein VUN84_08385 [Micrococcaceae bacterium Sec5.8]
MPVTDLDGETERGQGRDPARALQRPDHGRVFALIVIAVMVSSRRMVYDAGGLGTSAARLAAPLRRISTGHSAAGPIWSSADGSRDLRENPDAAITAGLDAADAAAWDYWTL